jgi:hypothetical protein
VAVGGDTVGRGEEEGRAAGRRHRRSRRGGRAGASGRGGQAVLVGGGRDAEDAGADAWWAHERKVNGADARGSGEKRSTMFLSRLHSF